MDDWRERQERHERDAFTCAPGLRIDAQERLVAMQFAQVAAQLGRLETLIERLERRLWMTVYGVAAAVLSQYVIGFVQNGL